MKEANALGAVVLCGGESRRMGRPKLWLPFGSDEVLLQRVVRLVGLSATSVVVVAAPGQTLPELPQSVRIVFDRVSNRGPLQGLAAGLAALPASIELAYATATDVPFLEPRWVRILRDRIGENDLAIPYVEGRHHPLAAVYRKDRALPVIEQCLEDNVLRTTDLLARLQAVILTETDFRPIDPQFRTVQNLNTPEDYRRALAEEAAGVR